MKPHSPFSWIEVCFESEPEGLYLDIAFIFNSLGEIEKLEGLSLKLLKNPMALDCHLHPLISFVKDMQINPNILQLSQA